MPTPETPGPPGLKNSDPIRRPRRLARRRMTFSGRDQSNGTGTCARCSRAPGAAPGQPVQAIRIVTADLGDGPGEAMAAGVSVAPRVPTTNSVTSTARQVEPTDPNGVTSSKTRASREPHPGGQRPP
jgi:hypothetical protein